MEREELTLTIHGLDIFNGDVDGEVFARKFFKFMQGLAEADKATNGSRALSYLITDLARNTATARVREQITQRDTGARSGIEFYAAGVQAIYEDAPSARQLPRQLVKYVLDVTTDVGKGFARGEIKRTGSDNVIWIDEHLRKNAKSVLADINRASSGALPFFAGTAHGSFDGTLRLLDALHGGERAVLVLTAGGKQIDCDISAVEPGTAGAAYKKRCVVFGTAHYDGQTGLPSTIVARMITPVEAGDLKRWGGAFEANESDEGWTDS